MSKIVDWNKIASVNFDDNRRKKVGQITSKELFQKAHERMQEEESRADYLRKAMPILQNELIKSLSTKTPILVKSPIKNPTEALGGVIKSQDDEFPDFYNSTPSNQGGGSTANARFEEVMQTIPAGITLMFKSWDKTLDQMVFRGSDGEDYAIYTRQKILFKGQSMENPGLFGLLFNTNLADILQSED
jgi:hypothetical protein